MASETYDVFVSYSRADWRHAVEINSVLRDKRLRSLFDHRNLAAGLPWVRALAAPVARSVSGADQVIRLSTEAEWEYSYLPKRPVGRPHLVAKEPERLRMMQGGVPARCCH